MMMKRIKAVTSGQREAFTNGNVYQSQRSKDENHELLIQPPLQQCCQTKMLGFPIDWCCRIFLMASVVLMVLSAFLIYTIITYAWWQNPHHRATAEVLRRLNRFLEAREFDPEYVSYMTEIDGAEICAGSHCITTPRFRPFTDDEDFRQRIITMAHFNEQASPPPPSKHQVRRHNLSVILKDYFMIPDFMSSTRNRAVYLHGRVEELNRTIPRAFDARKQWPECFTISDVTDQAGCGSCWAFSIAGMLADRLCIATNGTKQARISVQDMLECGPYDRGCEGVDTMLQGLRHWLERGIVTGGPYGSFEGCKPYKFPAVCGSPCQTSHYILAGMEKPSCEKECWDGRSYEDSLIKGEEVYSVGKSANIHTLQQIMSIVKQEENVTEMLKNLTDNMETYRLVEAIDKVPQHRFPDPVLDRELGIRMMQAEMMERGPLATCFEMREDFPLYRNGIYHTILGELVYGHCVKIIGWGVTQTGVKYWQLTNSWGREWGEHGHFRVLMDAQTSGFLENVFGLWPDI